MLYPSYHKDLSLSQSVEENPVKQFILSLPLKLSTYTFSRGVCGYRPSSAPLPPADAHARVC